jgi:tetratricopeptide (TPR) repeat protein
MNESNAVPIMKSMNPPPPDSPRRGLRLAGLVLLGCLLLALLAILRPSPAPQTTPQTNPSLAPAPMTATHSGRRLGVGQPRHEFAPVPARPAEEIVAEKLTQFASNRTELVTAMATHFNVAVPPDVARFFAAVQAGNWPETTNQFAILQKLRWSADIPPGLENLWPAIVETYGVAEATHKWPAQQLLDYGNAVLDSLRPGMIYLGGNDAGRFIPTLLTETSGDESYLVLTQNALADGSYLDYIRFQYGDKLNFLTSEDSQHGFKTYLEDAQKRLKHDQDFPNEPKQIRPGEDIRITDGRVQVSGQVAVMAINEELVRTLMQKNPDLSFALEESFPLKSFYGEATTLGPIIELRSTDPANALTPERAAQTLDHWRSTTQTLLADLDAAASPAVREAYTKMILGQGGLFQERELTAAAEQAFQLATSLSPANPEGVFRYVALLVDQNRYEEARQIVQTALITAPDNQQFRAVLTNLEQAK